MKATVEKGAESTLVYLQLMPSLKKAAKNLLTMELRASGAIDHSDVNISLDVQNPGQLFTGFGGNFRLQNPNADPKVIDYCLENLRVAYGRVEMPWRIWEAEVGQNPLTAPQSVALHQHVEESMLMAKRLRAMGMPVILSCWFPPLHGRLTAVPRVTSARVVSWRIGWTPRRNNRYSSPSATI